MMKYSTRSKSCGRRRRIQPRMSCASLPFASAKSTEPAVNGAASVAMPSATPTIVVPNAPTTIHVVGSSPATATRRLTNNESGMFADTCSASTAEAPSSSTYALPAAVTP